MITIDPTRYKGHPDLYKAQLAQSEIMGKEIFPIANIYFDLMCLKDLQLGCLLSFITESKNEEQYQYLLKQYSEYASRIDRDIMNYFPLLPYTEEDITNRLKDPNYTDKIFVLAPTTACYENLHHILGVVKKHNNHTSKAYPVRVVINVHPLPLSEYIKAFYANLISMICPTYKVAFIAKPFGEVSLDTLYSASQGPLFKLMFMWDVADAFLSDTSHSKEAFTSDLIFQEVQIYSPKKIQIPLSKMQDVDPESLDESLTVLYNYLNICCHFSYLDFSLTDDDTTPQKE